MNWDGFEVAELIWKLFLVDRQDARGKKLSKNKEQSPAPII